MRYSLSAMIFAGVFDRYPRLKVGSVEHIREIDLETMGSGRAVEGVRLVTARADAARDEHGQVSFIDLLPRRTLGVLAELIEINEQARGYFERVVDQKGIFGPPAVLKSMSRLHATVHVGQLTPPMFDAGVTVDLPVRALPTFAPDSGDAVRELLALAADPAPHRVIVTCQNDGERRRLDELLVGAGASEGAGIERVVQYLHRGFIWGEPGQSPLALVP
ncbi:MAG: hypothetical protein L0271_19405, partial [Gemmatimonadetes bacterium]|nr:hypothetical protein [Gemmatimonadota bacterium]